MVSMAMKLSAFSLTGLSSWTCCRACPSASALRHGEAWAQRPAGSGASPTAGAQELPGSYRGACTHGRGCEDKGSIVPGSPSCPGHHLLTASAACCTMPSTLCGRGVATAPCCSCCCAALGGSTRRTLRGAGAGRSPTARLLATASLPQLEHCGVRMASEIHGVANCERAPCPNGVASPGVAWVYYSRCAARAGTRLQGHPRAVGVPGYGCRLGRTSA